jgi:hypothetical protein
MQQTTKTDIRSRSARRDSPSVLKTHRSTSVRHRSWSCYGNADPRRIWQTLGLPHEGLGSSRRLCLQIPDVGSLETLGEHHPVAIWTEQGDTHFPGLLEVGPEQIEGLAGELFW